MKQAVSNSKLNIHLTYIDYIGLSVKVVEVDPERKKPVIPGKTTDVAQLSLKVEAK